MKVALAERKFMFWGFGDFPKSQRVKTEQESMHHKSSSFPQRKARWMCSDFSKVVDICSLSLGSIICCWQNITTSVLRFLLIFSQWPVSLCCVETCLMKASLAFFYISGKTTFKNPVENSFLKKQGSLLFSFSKNLYCCEFFIYCLVVVTYDKLPLFGHPVLKCTLISI